MKGKTLVMFHNPPAITADDIAESNIKVNQIEACCVNMTPPAWMSPNTGSLQSQNNELKVVFAIALMIFLMWSVTINLGGKKIDWSKELSPKIIELLTCVNKFTCCPVFGL